MTLMDKLTRFITKPRTVASIALYSALVAYGLMNAEFGPALSYISNQTHTELGEVSLIFTTRYVGYFIGSISAGPVFDKITKECILLGVAMMIASVMNCVIPFIHNIIILHVVSTIQGWAFGALDVIGNVSILLLHGDKVAPWIQAMHFFFALGSAVSPLIIGAVIDAYNDIIISYAIIGFIGTVFGILLCFSPPFKQHMKDKDKSAVNDDAQNDDQIDTHSKEDDENKPLLEKGDDAVTTNDYTKDNAEPQNGDSKTANTDVLDKKTMKPGLFWTITVIVTIFIFTYTGIEGTYGGLMATYATEVGVTSSAGAAYMTSCFWGAFAIGRFIGIPITLFISPETYLMIVLILGAIFIAPNLFFEQKGVVWTVAILRGLLIAPTWATAWNVLGNKIEINGRAGTVVIVGGSMGQIIFPALCGFLMEKYGPIVLPSQQFACSCMELIIYIILIILLRHLKHKSEPKKEDLTVN